MLIGTPRLCLAVLLAGSIQAQEQNGAKAPEIARPAQYTPESRAKAVQILERARAAAGGEKKLAALRDITRTLDLTQSADGSEARQTVQIVFPRTLRYTNSVGQTEVSAFFDGSAGWVKSPWGFDRSLPDWQTKAAEQDIFRQIEGLLRSDRNLERTVAFVESREVHGQAADGIEIRDKRAGVVRLWIHASSGDPVALQYHRITARGEAGEVVEYFRDFKETSGVRTPRRISTRIDGKPYMETVVLDVAYNTGLKTETLARAVEMK